MTKSSKTVVSSKKRQSKEIEKNVKHRKIDTVRVLTRLRARELAKTVFQREEERKQRLIMTEFIKPASVLSFTGNLSENWRVFKRDFDIFMEAAELSAKPDTVKINLFLNAAGSEAAEMLESFQLTTGQRQSYKNVTDAFQTFCNQQKNLVYERFKFYQRKQKDGEPFDAFYTDLKKLAKSCEFGNETNTMIRDQIVMGTNNIKLQTMLLETSNLTCATAVEKARAKELTSEQATEMKSSMSNVNEIRRMQNSVNQTRSRRDEPRNNNKYTRRDRGRAQHTQHQQQNRNTNHTNQQQRQNNNSGRNTNNTNNSDMINSCKRCPSEHARHLEKNATHAIK